MFGGMYYKKSGLLSSSTITFKLLHQIILYK